MPYPRGVPRRVCVGLALCAVALAGCGLAIGKRQFVVEQGSSAGGISADSGGGKIPQDVSELPWFHPRGKLPPGEMTEAEEVQRFHEAVVYIDRHCPCTFEHTRTGLRVVSFAHP